MANVTNPNGLPAALITTLPSALTATAFVGIAWYLAVELNVRLFFTFTRRSLYFWSCLICAWGIIIHNLAITLFNFQVWTSYSSVVVGTVSWAFFVVPQSVVLYSRLSLVMKRPKVNRWVLWMIIVVSIVFGMGTVVIALVARYPTMTERVGKFNLIWDKIQLAAFFLQETVISLLYIRETRRYIRDSAPVARDTPARRHLLHNLIYVNIFIICLDCSLMGLCYAGYFFLQGHYKVAVYAIKLRTEFTILNQLRESLNPSMHSYLTPDEETALTHGRYVKRNRRAEVRDSQGSDIGMIAFPDQIRVDTVIRVERDRSKAQCREECFETSSRSEESANLRL